MYATEGTYLLHVDIANPCQLFEYSVCSFIKVLFWFYEATHQRPFANARLEGTLLYE